MSDDTSCRVAVYVKVTDIEGDLLRRHVTLGQAFCSSVLSRDFRNQIQPDGYDACHIPPNFDSDKDVYVYFLFDIGVKGRLPEEDLSQIPHFVYLASRAQGNWNFIPRPKAIEKAKQRARKYPWGGIVEQEMFAELLNHGDSGGVSPLHSGQFLSGSSS
ncbi:uncharacterized protein EI97DRAFT_461099 [Westerdykella ornata]|uniref:Uncharacterized protein n=1 Tax=Westerdykella ornata TaxID=318751 RepID=A0A6A6JE31_WESOR|nr:uncharacterized protein EI97DRAFT_461099 [Westerdykella ornata]KAF2273439.1 hypothetical protein EI97DRAFT_461099 [Westerdykella ornata]